MADEQKTFGSPVNTKKVSINKEPVAETPVAKVEVTTVTVTLLDEFCQDGVLHKAGDVIQVDPAIVAWMKTNKLV